MSDAPGNRVIFWDFDGTLAYRSTTWSGLLVQLLREHDPTTPTTRDDVSPYLGQGFPWHVPDVPHPELSTPDLWWEHVARILIRAYVGLGVPEDVSRELACQVRQRYLKPEEWALFDDTTSALRDLAAHGWRHVVLSNHAPELTDLVQELGLGALVETVISSANVGYEKPNPAIFRLALETAEHPRDTWMIGDNVVADVLGAESAGIRAILVRRRDDRARRTCADLTTATTLILGDGSNH